MLRIILLGPLIVSAIFLPGPVDFIDFVVLVPGVVIFFVSLFGFKQVREIPVEEWK